MPTSGDLSGPNYLLADIPERGHFPEAIVQRSSATFTPLPACRTRARNEPVWFSDGQRVIFTDRRKSRRVRRRSKLQSSTGADCSGDVTPGSSSMILMLRK
jgi:hypothetical protein